MARVSTSCPPEEALQLYLGGRLAQGEAEGVRAHVVACATCRDLVAYEAQHGPPDAEVAADATLLAGKYALERELGSGAMGRVYLARHVKLGKHVAVKVLHDHLARDPRIVERFSREARAAAALKSRHVVDVLDIDVTQSGEPFLVMELLEGMTVGAKVAEAGPLPVDEALRIIAETCEALAEAHEAGILHRDVKPENLFLSREGEGPPTVKVLDFGLAKALPGGSLTDGDLTARSQLLGSPSFMSPEQFRGDVDARTDIWAVGATLHVLLTGEPPFVARDFEGLRAAITSGRAIPIEERRKDAPRSVCAVVETCLATRREDRFPDMRALGRALAEARAEQAAGSGADLGKAHGRALPFDLGRYTVLRRIAAGGMGTVYLGRASGALGFSRNVAIKQLHAHLAQDGDTRRRFLAEARVVAHVDHPNVVKVLDVVDDADEVFLVLEYVDGETLEQLLRTASERSAPVPLAIISAIFGEVAEALHAAHEAVGPHGVPLHVVHRDVSPHNVLVAKHGAAYVTDFGIAAIRESVTDARSAVMGKTGYMAPEQFRGEQVARAADLFALGVMLWEALSRQRLFPNLEERLRREASSSLVHAAPSAMNREVPAELDALVIEMLARDPVRRPQTALDVARRLRRIVPPSSAEHVKTWVASLSSGRLDGLEVTYGPIGNVVVRGTPQDRPSGHTDTVMDLGSGSAARRALVSSTNERGRARVVVPFAATAALVLAVGLLVTSARRGDAEGRLSPSPPSPPLPHAVASAVPALTRPATIETVAVDTPPSVSPPTTAPANLSRKATHATAPPAATSASAAVAHVPQPSVPASDPFPTMRK